MQRWLRGLLLLSLLGASLGIGIQYDTDFPTLYKTVRHVAHGEWASVYERESHPTEIDGRVFPTGRYFYLPVSLVVFGPLGFLKYAPAKVVWLVGLVVCFILFWILLGKLFPFLTVPRASFFWVFVFLVSINPLHNTFQSNNISLILAVLCLAAEVLRTQGKGRSQESAGLLIVLAAALKVFPAFLAVLYFLIGSKRLRLGILGGTALAAGLPFVVFGLETGTFLYQGFWANVTSYGADNNYLTTSDINSWLTMVLRAGHVLGFPAGTTEWIGKISTLGIAALFFCYVLWRLWRQPFRGNETVRLWALGAALMTFLNPSSRPNYFIFYVPMVAALGEVWLSEKRRGLLVATILGLTLLCLTVEWVTGKYWNNILEWWSLPTIGMATLILTLAASFRNTTRFYASPTVR